MSLNPFSTTKADLGIENDYNMSKLDVDKMLLDSQFSTGYTCIVCGNTAKYKLIPKHPSMASEELEKSGYVCGHCKAYMNQYNLRELR